MPLPHLVERQVGPDRADHTERHAHPEHCTPVPLGEHPADHQADERPGDGRDLVDAQGGAPLVDRERIGEDRGRVGHEHGRAHGLYGAPGDEPVSACRALPGDERERDRREGKDEEAGVVDPDASANVAEATEHHHECRGDQHEAEQHPQQVGDVGRVEGVQPDPAEDGGQRDQHDRGVDGGHRHAERGVGQCDPLVARVVLVHARAARARRPCSLLRLTHAVMLAQIVSMCKLCSDDVSSGSSDAGTCGEVR